MCQVPNVPDFILLAVFDGHGSDGAAIFSEATLLNMLNQTRTIPLL